MNLQVRTRIYSRVAPEAGLVYDHQHKAFSESYDWLCLARSRALTINLSGTEGETVGWYHKLGNNLAQISTLKFHLSVLPVISIALHFSTDSTTNQLSFSCDKTGKQLQLADLKSPGRRQRHWATSGPAAAKEIHLCCSSGHFIRTEDFPQWTTCFCFIPNSLWARV